MIGFVRGKVHAFGLDYCLIDVNGIGYRIHFRHPEKLKVNEEVIIYTYQNVREDEISLYGFLSLDEYNLFTKLISVKGLGPRMALPIIATGTVDGIADAIENNNLNYLKKFPKIGDKVAKQMVLDLKGKLGAINTGLFKKEDFSDELLEVLLGLGYKQADVKKVISKVDANRSLEEQVKEALKLMLK